jgi:hypothetical protein
MDPQWCLVATLLPYPYPPGPNEDRRSHGIFPAGARLHVIGGFAGMGYETVSVVGYAHHHRAPVKAHLTGRLLGGWRVQLVYRPAVLRAIHAAREEDPWACHRFLRPGEAPTAVTTEEYRDRLAELAAQFQERFARENP